MDRRLALFLAGLGAGAAAWFLLRNEKSAVLGSRLSSQPREEAQPPRRCSGITRGGSRCSREAEPESPFCWQHTASR